MSMSAFDDNQPERFPFSPERNEGILHDAREALLASALSRHDEAMALEESTGVIYTAETPLDTPYEEAIGVLLTPDGRIPFRAEETVKEQLWIIQVKALPNILWFVAVNDDKYEQFSLTAEGFSPTVDIDDAEAELADSYNQLDPTATDLAEVVRPIHPVSAYERIARLREKVERFQLTPMQDPPILGSV